jgi:3-oxoacyl-[acyl-carrier protein] reductase
MDLKIANRQALVCAASKGLGYACAKALAREGVAVTIVSRTKAAIDQAAEAIARSTGATVVAVAADVTTPDGLAAALEACPAPDILVNNAGGPPAGDFRKFDRDDWIKAVDANMLSPIAFIKATVDGMIARQFGRIVNITSGGMRVPIPILPLSNGARGGLTAFVAGIAGQLAEHNVTINNLLPGPFDTDRLAETIRAAAVRSGRSEAEERKARLAHNPARRAGRPDEFGAMCAFLCSDHAGYITGQNILLDGGASPTTF